ncbi:hypothetical protein NDU88_005561 [Pleurodeles waltl]|uniref:Uncharacterized protein n=1 Tax=Pleurodeles waltl TaxID=8319 RepID=A0AAV7SM13_PLEWA|nr:hypothetical protein NDU88_005561 [Pleurodeles waltl]
MINPAETRKKRSCGAGENRHTHMNHAALGRAGRRLQSVRQLYLQGVPLLRRRGEAAPVDEKPSFLRRGTARLDLSHLPPQDQPRPHHARQRRDQVR